MEFDGRKPAAKVELGERRIWFWVGVQGESVELNTVRILVDCWADKKSG